MENPTKIEIEGLKTIHKLCKFGADHNMEGCSFAEIVERMFDELQQAKKVAVPDGFVLMPLEIDDFDHPITKALEKGIVKDLSASVIYKAMIEAQEPSHD